MVNEPTRLLARRPAALALLRVRDFRVFWLSGLGGGFGLNLWFLAASWLMLELTNSQLWVGLIGGAVALSATTLVLFGGAITDRGNRRRILIVAALVYAALALFTASFDLSGLIRPWHVLAAAMSIGAADAFASPANRSLVVELVGTPRLLAANALGSVGEFSGEVIAPLVMGFLIAASGTHAVHFLSAGALLISALLLMRIGPRPPAIRRAGNSMLAEIVAGLRYTRRTPPLPALLTVAAMPLFSAAVYPLIPVYARDVLEVGARGFGVMVAGLAAGMLVGALVLAAAGDLPRRGLTVLAYGAIWGGGMVAFAFSTSYPLSVVILFVMGMASAIGQNLVTTMIQTHAGDEMRGRVMSVARITDHTEPLGFMLGGAVAAAVSNEFALVAGAAMSMSVVALVFLRSAAFRRA